MEKKIDKILVANRGEIAVRVMQTASKLGIKTVAVFSDADKHTLFVEIADETVALTGNTAAETYLDQNKIIAAAKATNAQAIHPGYGFLSENASFAKRCVDEGIIFIGPTSDVIEKLGSKSAAKEIAAKAGVPTVPGYNDKDQSLTKLSEAAKEIGFPLLVKASAGGGGKGMRIVHEASAFQEAVESAKREAEKSFGDDTILLEKYFPKAKHIEFQILGDEHGNHIHLFDRECSMQRRYQKIIEESPSPSLSSDLRKRMGDASVALAKAVNYTNAGTIEFLLDESGNFYFLEVNTRLQVEHPVTEKVLGIDLVECQINVSRGLPISLKQEAITQKGHAIECRICAENPEKNFSPSTGKYYLAEFPSSEFIRTDSGLKENGVVEPYYDSMLAKVITYGRNRHEATQQMVYALGKTKLLGISTNVDFLKYLLANSTFADGTYYTKLIEKELSDYKVTLNDEQSFILGIGVTVYSWLQLSSQQRFNPSLNGWRNITYSNQSTKFMIGEAETEIFYRYNQNNLFAFYGKAQKQSSVELLSCAQGELRLLIDGSKHTFTIAHHIGNFFIHHVEFGTHALKAIPRFAEVNTAAQKGSYLAPMPGEVIKVLVKSGDVVESGKPLFIINSMKMETTIEAHTDGTVAEIFVNEKSMIEANTLLLKMKD